MPNTSITSSVTLRNYISNLQFIVTPQFEAYYRRINQAAGEEKIRQGLAELRKFQGGVIGGSGLNDYENELLGGASGFEMFGCCAGGDAGDLDDLDERHRPAAGVAISARPACTST